MRIFRIRRCVSLFLCAALLLCLCSCSRQESVHLTKEADTWTFSCNGVQATLDPQTGFVTGVQNEEDRFSCSAIMLDAGADGASLFSQLGYKDMDTLATYELPTLYPRMKPLPSYHVDAIETSSDGFTVRLCLDPYSFVCEYHFRPSCLSMDVTLEVSGKQQVAVNGIGLIVSGIEGFSSESTTFEFPGSTPEGKHHFGSSIYKPTCADYSAPAVVLEDGEKAATILFADEVEKWTTGCYLDHDGRPCVAFLAAVQGWLTPETPMKVGTFYLPLQREGLSARRLVSQIWKEAGFHTPDDSDAVKDVLAIYSGHPFGTMDTGFQNKMTLDEYAGQMDHVAAMGFDAVWLLPVFSHSGDNVYEPIDQGVIDVRYGGEGAAQTFLDKTHALGMKVLFDFVPHGPRPNYAFAKEHDDWISKNIYNQNQIEWECVSFDYNNESYRQYSEELAKKYAAMGLDGARVDCSMGGLPNWYSPTYLRASASGLQGGRNIVSSLRQGFLEGREDVVLLPENFHPIPTYASVTDIFYDMPLYRCLYDLNQKGLDETSYVRALSEFLQAEHDSSVFGQLKLRFLGNHDTVTWTFDAQRAQTLYGTEKAKSLWMALAWIDGVFYLYQGDEDPGTYGLEGENLEPFFTELLSAKRQYLPHTLDTVYLETDSPVFSFYRFDKDTARLVLVNFSDTPQRCPVPEGSSALCQIGDASLVKGEAVLGPYAGMILETDVQAAGLTAGTVVPGG